MSLILELRPDGMLDQDLRDSIAIIEIVGHALERSDNLCLDRGCIVHKFQAAVQETQQKRYETYLQGLADQRVLKNSKVIARHYLISLG